MNTGLRSSLSWARTLGATVVVAGAAFVGSASAASRSSVPTLVGAARPGALLKVVGPAGWHARGTHVSYAWLACDQADCALITYGARPSLVVPSGSDPSRSWYVSVVATVTGAHGTTTTTLFSDPIRP